MKISIVGSGYVGLVLAACFSDAGNEVICIDKSQSRVRKLQDGHISMFEPGLETLIKSNLLAGRLKFISDIKQAVQEAELIFIAVGTPNDQNGETDLTDVFESVHSIIEFAGEEKLVVLKSTVPVGTGDKIQQIISSKKAPLIFANNPEFLKEGAAVQDFLKPDRVIVGTSSDKAKTELQHLYSPFLKNGNPINFVDFKTAELTKYAANAFLATKISFINEIANLADQFKVDIESLKKGFTSDPRIGSAYFYPGLGYGGSCLPKDVSSLLKQAEQNGIDLPLLKATQLTNNRQIDVFLNKIKTRFPNVQSLNFGVWGLSFKPNTDDLREAPSLKVIKQLQLEGASFNLYDPVINENYDIPLQNKVRFCKSAFEAIENVDALLIFTEWNQFRSPDFKQMAKLMKNKLIFDGRNVYEPILMKSFGFEYYCSGRENLL